MRLLPVALAPAMLLCAPVIAQTAAPGPIASTAAAQKAVPFDQAEARAVVRELATRMEENFVFPEVAKAYGARLRAQLAAGAYDNFDDGDAFAKAVTADLQAVHADRHVALHPPRLSSDGATRVRSALPAGNQVEKSGWLAPGVAYISFTAFMGDAETLATIRQFLATHKDAKTLIIDARKHRGGGLAEMDLMFPQIFDQEAVLAGMDTRLAVERASGSAEEDWTLRKVAGPAGVVRREHYVVPAADRGALSKAKVFLLTSSRTASAGEHLAMALKRTGRATLIGETTRGAGHYGTMMPLPHDYSAFIPFGRTFDPATDQGWEAVGVEPHVKVAAEKALDEALRLAGARIGAEAALASLK